MSELSRIIAVSAVTIAGFLFFYPPALTWPALIAEGLLCVAVLAAGYLAMSAKMRLIAREEIGVSLRALRPT